jgi:hypothetical protein
MKVAKQNPAAWIGLFVVFFALYARERGLQLKAGTAELPEVALPTPVPFNATQNRKIEDLAAALRADPLFSNGTDGIRTEYRFDRIVISYSGEDVYQPGEFAMRETWYTSLDRLGQILAPFLDRGLQLEFTGHAEASSPLERQANELGSSSYALAFSRAEWVARFLERRAMLPLQGKFKLSVGGSSKRGRQVDVVVSFAVQ